MKIAVIGGGISGCATAAVAARAGHDVHLYETHPSLMSGASGSSYYRFHRGYHYPRSPSTGAECRRSEESFREMYGDCLIDDVQAFYAIANEGSRTTPTEFMDFMELYRMPWSRRQPEPLINCENVFQVAEPRINETRLAELAISALWKAGVKMHTGTPMPGKMLRRFEKIIVCTYTNLNGVLVELAQNPREYKFQVVEKPVIKLPEGFKDTSIVILDGDFCCVDPFEITPYHVLGHVTKTIHVENIGFYPDVPEGLADQIDKGLISRPDHTRHEEVIEAVSEYIPLISTGEYMGSMFTLRAHLSGVEATDMRPTIVRTHGDRVVSIFTGKIGSAVAAAKEVLSILDGKDALEPEEATPSPV